MRVRLKRKPKGYVEIIELLPVGGIARSVGDLGPEGKDYTLTGWHFSELMALLGEEDEIEVEIESKKS